MAMFVDMKSRVPVTLDGNTIYIRAKMSAGIKAQVENEIGAVRGADSADVTMTGLGSYRLALLRHNIVAWEGPAFEDESGKSFPCNRTYIDMLDLDDPLIELVGEEIGKRNPPKEAPDPN